MQLQAVVIPPADVIEAAGEVARGLIPQPEAPVEEPRRGLMARFRPPPPVEVPPALALARTATDAVFVRVSRFGNVTNTDADALAKAFRQAAEEWPAPMLRVASVAVSDDDELTVLARLQGDTDALFSIFRNVVDVAKAQGFFLDRRSFRNEFVIGSVEVPEGAAVPASLPGASLPVEGTWWQPSHVTLLRSTRIAESTTYEVFDTAPLATPRADASTSQGA